jgi:hypothetical protein
MKYLVLFLPFTLCLLPACQRSLGPPADVAEADRALRTALDAWKSGKSPAELEAARPSILVNDDDWRMGKHLLDFQMEECSLAGRQVRCRVRLKLQDRDGKTNDQAAVYVIDTTPRIVIVRDSFAL